MTAKIASRPSVGLFAPCNIAVEIITTSMLIAESVRIKVPYGSPNLIARQSACRTTHMADQRMMAKSQRKAASSGSARVVRSLSWLPTATKIAAVVSPISSGNSERMALPNGCVFFAC